MKKNEIVEQINFCSALTEKLKSNILAHEEHRLAGEKPCYHCDTAHYGNGLKERGASKTQIQGSIVQLRRELNTLSRMFEDW